MQITYEIEFLKALLMTISIETIVLILISKTVYKRDNISYWILAICGVVASMATLPYLWFILPVFVKSKLWYKVVSELTAFILEIFIIKGFLRVDFKKSTVLSFACNLISYVIGLVYYSL